MRCVDDQLRMAEIGAKDVGIQGRRGKLEWLHGYGSRERSQ